MASEIAQHVGDSTPVTGGVDLPASLIAPTADESDAPPRDDLGRQAYWLLKLHADKIAIQVRPSDLKTMDDEAKRRLIADIQAAIGVSPFKKSEL